MTDTTGAREGWRLKPVLNRTEAVVHDRLIKTCEPHGSSVYPKMRVADVLPITASGIQDAEFSFALKSHFDFVVVDGKDIPLFAVEFDGPLHGDGKQITRDAMKDDLCKTFELPLLRVREAHLEVYRTYDLLSWIVEQWFLREAFDEAQQRGHIPYDEDFDPLAIVSMESGGPRFPMWLSLDAQLALQRLRSEGTVMDRVPSFTVSTDDKGGVPRAVLASRLGVEAGGRDDRSPSTGIPRLAPGAGRAGRDHQSSRRCAASPRGTPRGEGTTTPRRTAGEAQAAEARLRVRAWEWPTFRRLVGCLMATGAIGQLVGSFPVSGFVSKTWPFETSPSAAVSTPASPPPINPPTSSSTVFVVLPSSEDG